MTSAASGAIMSHVNAALRRQGCDPFGDNDHTIIAGDYVVNRTAEPVGFKINILMGDQVIHQDSSGGARIANPIFADEVSALNIIAALKKVA